MQPSDFYTTIITFCRVYDGSISSMHRTAKHNDKVGGAPNSQHLGFKAADLVCDSWANKDKIIAELRKVGFFVLDEVASKNHLHIDDRYNALG